jgi:hypothetical protein
MREQEMYNLYLSGLSFKQIGEQFGISTQRAHQLVNRSSDNQPRYRVQDVEKAQEAYMQRFNVTWSKLPVHLLTSTQTAQKEFFQLYKTNAKRRNVPWTLSIEDIEWTKRCPLTSYTFDWFSSNRVDASPTLILKDQTLGYIPGNVLLVSWKARKNKSYQNERKHQITFDFSSPSMV